MGQIMAALQKTALQNIALQQGDMTIYYFSTGYVQIKSRHHKALANLRVKRVFDVLTDKAWSPKLPIGCWLIEHPEGLFMVDTGESVHANDKGYQPFWHPFMRFCERRQVKENEAIAAQLKVAGIDPLSVKTVVMTHMHGDHAGGIPAFKNAKFLLTKEEHDAILSPFAKVNGYLTDQYPSWFSPSVVDYKKRFYDFDAHVLTKDGRIVLIKTPGHTKGCQSLVVDMGGYQVLIGGDVSYSEQDFLAGRVDGVCVDANVHKKTTQKLRKLCHKKPTIVQLAHDIDSPTRLKNKAFTKATLSNTIKNRLFS